MPTGAEIPVETLLKVVLDKSGSDSIRQFLDHQEKQWSSIESSVGRIGSGLGSIKDTIGGLIGLGSVGALVNQFAQLGDSASSAALMAGRVRGGPSAYTGYMGAFNQVQMNTGVSATAVAQGFISAVQMVGGRPTPAQAATIGGLLAGFGETVGMSPAQVASVIAPILLATGQPLSGSSLQTAMATVSQQLSAFPGAQAGQALPVVAGQLSSLAIGGNGPVNPSMAGQVAGLVNASAQLNPTVFGHGNVHNQQGALNAIDSTLQNAYQSPGIEAFLQMAGVSYSEQRAGLTPATMLKIANQAQRLYPDKTTRDIALRAMFGGILPADQIETLSTPKGIADLQKIIAQGNGSKPANVSALLNEINHAQQRTAPSNAARRGAAAVVGGVMQVPKNIIAGLQLPSNIAAEVLGVGNGSPTSTPLAGLAGLLSHLLGTAGDPTHVSPATSKGNVDAMVYSVLLAAQGKFGADHLGSTAAVQWMKTAALTGKGLGPGGAGNYAGGAPSSVAEHLLEQVLSQSLAQDPNDPNKAFADAVAKFGNAVDKLPGTGGIKTNAAYFPGGSAAAGAPMMQLMAATAPGYELASFFSAGSSAVPGYTTASVAGGGMSKQAVARALMAKLGIKPTSQNTADLMAWMQREGGNWNNSASFNPLNTTLAEPGSRSMGGGSAVQAYLSWAQGLAATSATMVSYPAIIRALKENMPLSQFAQTVATAPGPGGHHWGTPATGWPTTHGSLEVKVFLNSKEQRNARIVTKHRVV